MKVIIAGSRDFNDYDKLKSVCNEVLKNFNDVEIVSGTAKGADELGIEYAEENNYQLVKFPAQWHRYRKRAGYIRNKQMAEYSDMLIAFWNGKSRGTKMMINLANEKNLQVKIVNY